MSSESKYKITERVDQGGMAEVFKGVMEGLPGMRKNVAIKRILPNLTKNKKFVSMFLDEARLSLHLQHANIVHVFDIGVADSSYFIVMEFVDGCNLKAVIEWHKKKGRTVPLTQLLYSMLEVCKGLAYAHDMADPETGRPLGIVHRDISPPNILLSKTGEVKLVDFGLAKANSQLEDTDPGVVKGKFSYLSPEAASGQPVDHRADIFAVGILMWEMLTNKRLFFGETDYQTVELVRQARVPPLAALNPEVEPELEGIVRKALAKDPENRYQHGMDLGDAIAQYLFSRGRKVTQRDIASMVRQVVDDRVRQSGTMKKPGIIDTLISEEIIKFTSLDMTAQDLADIAAGTGDRPPQMSQPLGPEASQPLDPSSFIDPREWVDDSITSKGKGGGAGLQAAGGKGQRGAATGGGGGGGAGGGGEQRKGKGGGAQQGGATPNGNGAHKGQAGQAAGGKGGNGAGVRARGSGAMATADAGKQGKRTTSQVEDLQALLEPDKTGAHPMDEGSGGKAALIAVITVVVLGGAAAVGHFVLHLF